MYKSCIFDGNFKLWFHLMEFKILSLTLILSLPVFHQLFKSQIITSMMFGKVDQKKTHPSLLFKIPHKCNLMVMYILKRKGIRCTLLGIKAYRNSLNCSNIIHRTFLIKIGQRYMTVFFIKLHRFNGSWNLLYQRQILFPISFIGQVR